MTTTAAKKLLLVALLYGLVSANLIVLFHLYLEPVWFDSHMRWSYMIWQALGPGAALEYAWHGAWPLREHLAAAAAGGLVVVPLLAAPLFGNGRLSLALCAAGVLVWTVLGANLSGSLGPEIPIDGLIASVAELT